MSDTRSTPERRIDGQGTAFAGGKVVAITGGARGIGKATATALVREGAKVAIGDLDKPLAEEAAAELGGDAIGLELDVTDRDSFADFLDQVRSGSARSTS